MEENNTLGGKGIKSFQHEKQRAKETNRNIKKNRNTEESRFHSSVINILKNGKIKE